MKKNAFILIGLCVLGICSGAAKAMHHQSSSIVIVEDNVPTGYELIVLRGSLMTGANPNAINAGANRNSVYLHFNQNFGNVGISIYNESGNRVYSAVVDTSVQQTFVIPIAGNSNGTFNVVLDNANGFAEGDFERQSH